MTSTVLDVTVLLLCVSAGVVTLSGVGGDVGVRGPSAGETADRLVTETVTVRYRAPAAANGTRGIRATRAELLALLVADVGGSNGERGAAQDRDNGTAEAFESRATAAVAAGLGERTRIDATVPTPANRGRGTGGATAGHSAPTRRDVRRGAEPRAVLEASNASEPARRDDSGRGSNRSEPARSAAAEPTAPVTVGAEPPRGADVVTAVVTHPMPSGTEADGAMRIVVRRW
ncbi:hypothetical protein ACFQMF_08990 [Halorubrum rutilum]|uniref:Secreted protein n=1 Tax=Halorubrum rutilum TaxID=1364933 RepID=A0ABD6AKD0_9EURY|nr:hypothetical protein [Halorubrum rutilum]